MGLLEFDKLPINTLVGADWDTFRKVTARQQIDKGFKGKYRLTTAARDGPLVYLGALAEWYDFCS